MAQNEPNAQKPGNPVKQPPFAAGLRQEIAQEVAAQDAALASQGITAIQEGLEIEISLVSSADRSFSREREKLAELKALEQRLSGTRLPAQAQEVVDQLEGYFASRPSDAEFGQRWQESLAQQQRELQQAAEADPVAREQLKLLEGVTNARELILFETIREMPGVFDTSKGMYDGLNVLEAIFEKTDHENLASRREEFLAKLSEKVEYYGLEIAEPHNAHYSFSFIKDGKNVLDSNNPEFLTTGKKILEGIAAAFHEASAAIVPLDEFGNLNPQPVTLSPSRESSLRLANGRLEYRSTHDHEHENAELIALIVRTGAAYGLAPQDQEYYRNNVQQAELIQRPLVQLPEGSGLKVTSHLINGSVLESAGIGEDGRERFRLELPPQYLEQKSLAIGYELGIKTAEELAFGRQHLGADIDGLSRRAITDYFKDVTLVQEEGKFVFEWPQASGNPAIDVERLRSDLASVAAAPSFRIRPGYDPDMEVVRPRRGVEIDYDQESALGGMVKGDDESATLDMPSTRPEDLPKKVFSTERLVESVILSERLSPAFMVKVTEAARQDLGYAQEVRGTPSSEPQLGAVERANEVDRTRAL